MNKALKTIAIATVIFTMTGCGLAEQIAMVPVKVVAGVVVPAVEVGMVIAKIPITVVDDYKNERAIAHSEAVSMKMNRAQKQTDGKTIAAHLNQDQTAPW